MTGRHDSERGGRLDQLLGELGAEAEASDFRLPTSGGDAFFTAQVLDALPEPLRWTGASPLTRVATILGFHVAAAVVGVMAYRWASPKIFDLAASRAAEAASPWASSLALVPVDDPVAPAVAVVAFVGLVAFWATRSHTRAT